MTVEMMNLLIQFGIFLVGLIGLMVTIAFAVVKLSKGK